jgi:Protein of unknown function (DUF4038)/Putative collagen-binding domain of a collagenase
VKNNIRITIWLIAGLLLFSSASAFAAVAGRLKVTENRRYLQYENGKPFFYLGDTAWELFHRLNREEATQYLTNRSQKGFTVIQAVVLAQIGGLTVPNPYGDLPLIDGDPAKPNEAYFRHVDFIVNKAEELGMFVGMLPTWGSHWALGKAAFNPTNARQYGQFLGKRYKEKAIIWILGGDRSITNDAERAIIDAMAVGLGEGDGGVHLKTFHPIGPGLSSIKLHEAPWLDFNMFQSSHASRDHDNGLYVENDYALKPAKPTLDGEPRYEGIPVGFYNRGANGIERFDDYDVRQAAYWSLLAGACGYTYGNNNIWQMYKPGRGGPGDAARGRNLFGGPGSIIGANIPWFEALDHPGAFQMRHVRRLFESLPFTRLIPDQGIILNGPTAGGSKLRAARASDGSFAIVYSPRGETFTLDKRVIKSDQQSQYWYDPRYGVAYVFKEQDSWGIQTFTPPTSGRGNDWVLVLMDLAAGFSVPGINQ